jgi:hypothetical protein
MISFLLLVSLAVSSDQQENVVYRVAVESDGGKCIFLAGSDVELNARQLHRSLQNREEYDPRLRLDVITSSRSSERCIEIAVSAVRRAGFSNYAIRPGGPDDWFGPLPK